MLLFPLYISLKRCRIETAYYTADRLPVTGAEAAAAFTFAHFLSVPTSYCARSNPFCVAIMGIGFVETPFP